MEIRLAQAEDIPGILTLLRQVGQVHHRGRPDIFRAGAQKYNEAQLRTMLDQPEAPIFVGVEAGKLLGYGFCFLKCHQGDPVIADFRELYIDDLCVEENCRGQQVGRRLYEHICRHARTLGCRSVTLNVWCCNPGAMAFYKKMGMRPQKVGMETILEDSQC